MDKQTFFTAEQFAYIQLSTARQSQAVVDAFSIVLRLNEKETKLLGTLIEESLKRNAITEARVQALGENFQNSLNQSD